MSCCKLCWGGRLGKVRLWRVSEFIVEEVRPCCRTPLDLDVLHRAEIAAHAAEVQQLRVMIFNKPAIPTAVPDFVLVEHLYAAQFNLEAAVSTLTASYRGKAKNRRLFQERDPREAHIQRCWSVITLFSLPEKTKKDERLFYIGLHDTEPTRLNLVAACKLFMMAIEASLLVDGMSAYKLIVDAEGFALVHIPLSQIPLINSFLNYVKEGMPIWINKIYVINTTPTTKKIASFFMGGRRSEAKINVIFYKKGDKAFYSEVPLDLLHKELGGKLGPASQYQSLLQKKVEDMECWFLTEEYQRREAKRKK